MKYASITDIELTNLAKVIFLQRNYRKELLLEEREAEIEFR